MFTSGKIVLASTVLSASAIQVQTDICGEVFNQIQAIAKENGHLTTNQLTEAALSETTYCGVPPYDVVPGIDEWCDNNCLNPEFPFCPPNYCELCADDEGSFGGSFAGDIKDLINEIAMKLKHPVIVLADQPNTICDGSSQSTTFCGVPPYDTVPGMDCWCDNNCLSPEFPFCPPTHCELCPSDGSFGGLETHYLAGGETKTEEAKPPAPPKHIVSAPQYEMPALS